MTGYEQSKIWTRRAVVGAAVAAAAFGFQGAAMAGVAVGAPAPAFSGLTSEGASVSLADYAGKTVVLEWTNHGCPYVQKFYDAGAMQALQTSAADEDVVWLSVISSAPGKQGHVSPAEANDLTASREAAPAAVVLDESGDIGRAYGAKTTPHMYVIDGEGVLRYAGAIDDQPTAAASSLDGATNYVVAALSALDEGADVDPQQTAAYGCSVKY
ncbi:MAG: redoxin family protein [Pseudomonadota bacterium]